MIRSRFNILISLATCAILWAVSLPVRAIEFVASLVPLLTDPRPLGDFGQPALALNSPAPRDIDPSLYHENRHEAGLARLASVRHT